MTVAPELIVLRGLPASGKSTWAKQQVLQGNGSIVRVSKDSLREMLDNSTFSKERERLIVAARDALVETYLAAGKTVIVDDTNYAPVHEQTLRGIAAKHGAELVVREFTVPLHVCIERDAQRALPVGEKVIRRMANQWLTEAEKRVPLRKFEIDRMPAIIVDIDGTLALKRHRDIYDGSRCAEDEPNRDVVMLVSDWAASHENSGEIIFVSGRSAEWRDETADWICKNLAMFDVRWSLFMRPRGDNRPDDVVKKEIYDAHIRDVYNVLFVLDDRDSVVRMWRDQGLTCLQVWWGAF